MKTKIEVMFDDDERSEKDHYLAMQLHGGELLSCIGDFENYLRSLYKYEMKEEINIVEVRDAFYDIMGEVLAKLE